MSPAAGPTRDAFSTTYRCTLDADDHAACLTKWRQRYDQLSAGAFAGIFEEFWFGNVQVFREGLNQSVHQTGEPGPKSRTFAVPTSIDGTGRFAGEVFERSSMITLGSGDELDFRTPRQLEILACSADSEALGDYARQVDHRDFEGELTGRKTAPTTPQHVEALRALLSTMMTALRATPAMLRHAQMRTALEQSLFATLLDTVRAPADAPPAPPSGRARQYVVARARDYMQAHIEEPITVADLCIELGVSRRTLQYSFQDVLDLNPVRFLRALRLNAVRRALKEAEPNGRATVADIAARWGFWHLSHFATEYKVMFGELPSETLRTPPRMRAESPRRKLVVAD